MLKKEQKCDILPKLQKNIVLALAKFGPMNIRETNKKLKGEYTSTNRAFHELERKGIIQNVRTQQYRGREFQKFWLTDEGIVLALIHGANPDIVRSWAEQLYGENEAYGLISDLAKALPQERLSEIYALFKTTKEGKPQLKAIPITNNEAETFFKIVMKYPSFQAPVKKALEAIEKMFKEVLSHE